MGYDAFSLVANDVEIYRGVDPWFTFEFLKSGPLEGPQGLRSGTDGINAVPRAGADRVPYYMRVALVSGGSSLDYSDPVQVFGNGTVIFGNGTVL